MATYFINYNNTVDVYKNNKDFMQVYGDIILDLHKRQDEEEKVIGYSYIQYDVLDYYVALAYCINLFFLVLERVKDETIKESEKRLKKLHKFDIIQTNMAHKGVDLDDIYERIAITYTPIEYEH